MSVLGGPAPAFAFLYAALLFGLTSTAASPKDAFRGGLLTGFVANAWIFSWIPELLVDFAFFPWVAAIAVASLLWVTQALTIAFSAGVGESIVRALARRGHDPLAARVGILSALLVLSADPTFALFPWRPGTSTVEWTAFAQVAELGGAPFADALMLFVATSLAAGVMRMTQAGGPIGATRFLAVAVFLLGGALFYGETRIFSVEAERAMAPRVRVGLVQPNIGMYAKHDPRLRVMHLRALRRLTASLSEAGAEAVVWPETAYPYALPRDVARDGQSGPPIGIEVPMLVGAVTQAGGCERYNSTLAFEPGGALVGISDKMALVPFGERIPLWEWLPPLQTHFRCPGMVPAEHPQALRVGGVTWGPLNCFEDVLGPPVRWMPEAEILVNVTNDAWFGDTAAPHLHHLAARYRAIETRRDLVRAVNSGVSGHIDSLGREVSRTETFVRTTLMTAPVRLTGTTPWMRFGDLTSPAMLGWLLAMIVAARVRRSPYLRK